MESMKPNIPPLNIAKSNSNIDHDNKDTPARFYSNNGQSEITPPLTPQGTREQHSMEQLEAPRAIFHNYLRAFYPFHPAGNVSPSTVTLPLDQGDIILVHSVHTNGWADGTLLDSGNRGWLPTNYCEAYDQLPMRPLLKALTDFWDIIRGGCGSSLKDFGNQDLMRGPIAGVRFLLEKSECLTRESPLVKKYDGLRRIRKALLSDLSSLVKTAKRFQEVANGTPAEDEVEGILDEMLLKAFKIVTRGVRFLDVWNEEVGLSRTIAEMEAGGDLSQYELPPTPASESFSTVDTSATSDNGTERNESRQMSHSRMGVSRASMRTEMLDHPRPVSVSTKRISVSHRVSYTGPSSAICVQNLASGRLGTTYDAFLGVLGSFIGLHMQSRSSTELVITTQQAVSSCRALLNVVETVCEHDSQRNVSLDEARDAMCEKLSELVHAARDVFRPANAQDDDLVFMPDEGKRLMDAATDCVRAAGNCLAKARMVLEQTGDIELEAIDEEGASSTQVPDIVTPQAQEPEQLPQQPEEPAKSMETSESTTPAEAVPPPVEKDDSKMEKQELSLRLPPPPLQIPNSTYSPSTPGLTDATTPSSFHSHLSSHPSTLSSLPNSATLPTHFEKMSQSFSSYESGYRESHKSDGESFGRGVTSTGSSFTYNSHTRDSEMSGVSQTSTRATSPDIGGSFSGSFQGPSLKESVSHSTLAEENEETEAHLLEKTFAHELVYREGQVTGGSLRALIEKLTAHQSTPDAEFVSTFYLTFRLFATPMEFAEALAERFDYIGDTPHAAGPVRLRVYNVFKGWLESHWRHDRDNTALDFIINFAKTSLMNDLPSAGKRLVDLAEKVSAVHGPLVPRLVSSMGKTNTAIAQYVPPDTPLPPPILSKKESNMLKQWKEGAGSITILDFDPLELARQLTLKASPIFCSILPEELLDTEWARKSGSLAVNVRASSTLSTDLTHLVADSILHLEEPKKRAAIIKHWAKIASKCLELNNYDSLMAIICSLNSSAIARLHRTWEIVSQKTKATVVQLSTVMDSGRNYAVLRQRLQNTVPPCLPFVGTYLTDLTFTDHGNPSLRSLPTDDGNTAVINFDKHMKTARIISELQRFQHPYRLTEVPELQTWIQNELVRVRANAEIAAGAYYRRSLVLEPRPSQSASNLQAQSQSQTESNPPPSILDNAKDKFDFLAWTHASKPKSIATNG
ncbi:Guanine-nucleotide dissociation stimulator CDC25 [Penicillium argentinense]|uniref:Guanine-nucleotide dissociation stimulator CDC25 n=1 Tax=Penicillium argentinense TaxID=1131581 RepID=A0A9W9F7X5_9EURO|nr:Guanine-nucleotide dissociation stimulator CDC25 [Penicillium argentinense]KAJ5095270.1 Guanine-nucleotide dissociation stimulator CDC25 [Penicillium argentinense]